MVQLGVFLDDVARGGQERLVSTLDQVYDRGSEEILRSDTQLLRLEREMFGLGISEAHGQARHDAILAPGPDRLRPCGGQGAPYPAPSRTASRTRPSRDDSHGTSEIPFPAAAASSTFAGLRRPCSQTIR